MASFLPAHLKPLCYAISSSFYSETLSQVMSRRRSGEGDDPIDTITKARYPWFIMWQSFQGILLYILFKTLIFSSPPSITLHAAACEFLLFQSSLHLFSNSLFLVFSPPPVHRHSPINFYHGVLQLIDGDKPLTFEYRRRVWATYKLLLFRTFSSVSACVAVACISGSPNIFGVLGLRGWVAGMMYASHYRRWVLEFPIAQRRFLFHYKLCVPKAFIKAFKLSIAAYLLSLALSIIATKSYKVKDLMMEQIAFFLACFAVLLCWELTRHLLQVIFTERLVFAPPKGSMAALTNPIDHLLGVLEDATSVHHVTYLAYYDLFLVSESSVDTWRRIAFFENTGKTYTRVIAACLKPLEQLTMDLSSNHLISSADQSSRINKPFYDFQILAWCARTATTLTVRSKEEDGFRVAKFTGSNAYVISSLLSSLMAVEASMGKKTNIPSTNQIPNCQNRFKAAATALSSKTKRDTTKKRDTTTTLYKKNSFEYSKAYSLADILRRSIYQIVSAFHEDMVASSRAGWLQKDWITAGRPFYASRELLEQKLRMFLEFQAN